MPEDLSLLAIILNNSPILAALVILYLLFHIRLLKLESRLNQRVQQVESRLGERIGSVESRLGGRIGDVESRLGGRIGDVESRLGERIGSVESRLDGLRQSVVFCLEGIVSSIKNLFKAVTTLTGASVKAQVLSSDEAIKLIAETISFEATEKAISDLRGRNPISPDEVERLKCYVDKIKTQQHFTRDEVIDFYRLADKAASERTDEGTWLLLMLASFLFGLWLGQKG